LVGVRVPPSPYIKRPLEEEEHGIEDPRALLSSMLPTSLSLHLSVPCGSLKGCIGAKVNPPLHAVVLQDFVSDPNYQLPQSRLDQRSRGHHHSPSVYEYYEVLPLVALSHCIGVVTTS
jgi:hypothetical protein